MNLWETFKLAIRNITASKMRTFLTMLGIIIGVTAVIVIVGLGNGMQNYMRDQFASLGTNTLNVTITGRGSTRSVSVEDMYKIVSESPYLDLLSPTVSMRDSVKVGSETWSKTTATGVSEDYFAIKGYQLSQGRGLQYMDILDRKRVCVVGSYVNQTGYAGRALGDTIRIGSNQFTIVGVMAQQSDEMEEGGTDDCIFLPYSTASRLSYNARLGSYIVTMTSEEQASQAKGAIESALLKVFNSSNAYMVMSMSEMLDALTGMIGMVILVLSLIAAISLVVGGIGIMNIMLVSVTERTREIGIRKALGAKEGAILGQFVMEAGTTSALGGVLGIALGYGLCTVATQVVKSVADTPLTVIPSLGSVCLAFGVSVGIGVLFGFLPARKAANLNPIDALRYD